MGVAFVKGIQGVNKEVLKAVSTPKHFAVHSGQTYYYFCMAFEKNLISEKTINFALKRVLKARFKLGMFDGTFDHQYARIPYEKVACLEHRKKAVEVAEDSMVLLKNKNKNKNNILPLNKEKIKSIAVIGPNGADRKVLLGKYNGTPLKSVSILEGIEQAVSPDTRVYYSEGCRMIDPDPDCLHEDIFANFSEAKAIAEWSDIVIMALGLSPLIEGEQGDATNSDASGDRIHLGLPGQQQRLLEEICEIGKPVVQLYVKNLKDVMGLPHHSLRKIKKIHLKPEEQKRVCFTFNAEDFALFDEEG